MQINVQDTIILKQRMRLQKEIKKRAQYIHTYEITTKNIDRRFVQLQMSLNFSSNDINSTKMMSSSTIYTDSCGMINQCMHAACFLINYHGNHPGM